MLGFRTIERLGLHGYESDLVDCDGSGSSYPLPRFEDRLQKRYPFLLLLQSDVFS